MCVFCQRDTLSNILYQSEHFLLLADHAPVVAGHILILPRDHYTCYGAVPEPLDEEFLDLKALVTGFCRATYQDPVFFEHGIFHQTVFHAHLHVIPIGSFPDDIATIATEAGRTVASQADIRDWYEAQGHYFYLERLVGDDGASHAAIFPPSQQLYYRVLGLLREQTGPPGGWSPQPMRRLTGARKVQELTTAWRRYAD
jgi:diadenosine tetraphosphate (Ap4A) HIT family hydrolase